MATPRVYDRMRSFGGGMDAFRPASELDPDQCQLLQNVIVRDNYEVRTRPGFDPLGNFAPLSATQALFYFKYPTGEKLMMAQNGHLYSWNGANWSAALAFNLHDALARPAIAQGVDKLLISDGVQVPQIYDGNAFTATGPYGAAGTVAPVGCTILCWHAGRMFASGIGTAPDTVQCSNFLNFTDGNWDNVKLSFRVGNGDGQAIIALASMQQFNLAVLKENSVWLVNCDPTLQPSNWSAQEMGELVGREIGCVGRDAWCLYQNDLLFMSYDGVQSLQRMQAAAGQYQLSAPLSEPMQPYIDRINWSVAFNITAVKYRHLAIFFVPLDSSVVNNYALVWNGRIGQWAGFWTGPNVSCAAVTRFNKSLRLNIGDSVGLISQWKDYADLGTDSTYTDNGKGFASALYGRSLIFGNLDAQKKLRAALIRFNAGNTTVNLAANLDLTDDDTWSNDLEPSGDILPALLPILLSSDKPTAIYRTLEDLGYCEEVFLKISSTSGWWALRNFTLSGFMKPMRNDA